MSYEFFISLRYLRAKRKQVFVSIITFISMAGILLGVAALIIVLAVMNGFEKELRDKILGINAHIILMEYTGPMKEYARVKQDISAVPGVVASTPFIYTQAMLKNGDSVSGIVLRGLSPTDARDVINLGRMVEGRLENLSVQGREGMQMPKPLANVPGIVLGKELARHIGAFLNDTVHVVSPQGIATPMGMVPRMKKFVVVGIFESGFYEYDSTLAYLSLADSQDFLGLGDQVTGLEIKVDNIYNARDIAGAIEQKLGYPFWARDWMKMNRNLFAALRLEKRVMFIIVGLIVLVAGFNIICTLKHFPGLGRVARDTHVSSADITATEAQLDLSDWVPFRRVMTEPGIATMLGHVRVDAVDSTTPASFSDAVVNSVVRPRLENDGLLITDDFSMGAVTRSKEGIGGAAVKALNAGVDLILLCSLDKNYDVLMSALIEADRNGDIALDRENATRERLKKYVFVDDRELPTSAPVQAQR